MLAIMIYRASNLVADSFHGTGSSCLYCCKQEMVAWGVDQI